MTPLSNSVTKLSKDETLPQEERAQWVHRAETAYKAALKVDPYYCPTGFDYGNLLYEMVAGTSLVIESDVITRGGLMIQ